MTTVVVVRRANWAFDQLCREKVCFNPLFSVPPRSTLQPWRWACDTPLLTPPYPTLFAIIPRIWTHYRTRPNTSAPNQGQAPFWFHTNARMLIGEKIEMAGDYCSLLKNEGQFLHLSQPQLWQNQLLKMHTWHVLCSLQSPPVKNPSQSPRP